MSRAKVLAKAAVHRAWTSGSLLLHSTADIRHWRKADRVPERSTSRRHPSGGLRQLMPHERQRSRPWLALPARRQFSRWVPVHDTLTMGTPAHANTFDVAHTADALNTSGMLQHWTWKKQS